MKTGNETVRNIEGARAAEIDERAQAGRWNANAKARLDELEQFDDPAYRSLTNLLLERLSKFADGRALSILDVGCGLGFLSNAIAELGHHVTAIDPSGASIDKARELHKHELVTFYELSVEEFANSGELSQSHDVVIANMTLHCAPHLPTTLSCISDVMRSGALLFVTIPNPDTYLQGRSDVHVQGMDLRERQTLEIDFRIHGHEPHPAPVFFFHRPIRDYVATACSNGLRVVDFTIPEQVGVGRVHDITYIELQKPG